MKNKYLKILAIVIAVACLYVVYILVSNYLSYGDRCFDYYDEARGQTVKVC